MRTLNDLLPALTEPFGSHLLDLKPGATTRAKDRALALAYADVRVYQERLDHVVGPADWSVTFTVCPMGIVCVLTVLGVTKSDVGDYPLDYADTPNENKATTAAAQAFKRACAQFGVGRYLYELPRLWADYDAERKAFINPQSLVAALYQSAELAHFITGNTSPTTLPVARPDNNRLQERPAAAPVTMPASDPQLGLIARLVLAMQQGTDEEAEAAAGAIDAVGDTLGVDALSSLTSRERLRAAKLSKTTASTLIERLKELQASVAELVA